MALFLVDQWAEKSSDKIKKKKENIHMEFAMRNRTRDHSLHSGYLFHYSTERDLVSHHD